MKKISNKKKEKKRNLQGITSPLYFLEVSGGKKIKMSLFGNDMIVYLPDPPNFTRELLNLINNFSKMAGY